MPPSINAYWGEKVFWSAAKQRGFASPYVTHEGKAYQEMLRNLTLQHKAWYRTANPLCLFILCCFKDERANDIDNRVKVLQDAMVYAYVMLNDKQVKRLEVREGPRMTPATVFLHLSEILPDRTANLAWVKQGPSP